MPAPAGEDVDRVDRADRDRGQQRDHAGGVGVAVGRAVRASIVMINVIDFFMSLAIWGATTTVRVAG